MFLLFSFLATIVVVGVNMTLEAVMRNFSEYEKHHSLDAQEESLFTRLFILKFLNSGMFIYIYIYIGLYIYIIIYDINLMGNYNIYIYIYIYYFY